MEYHQPTPQTRPAHGITTLSHCPLLALRSNPRSNLLNEDVGNTVEEEPPYSAQLKLNDKQIRVLEEAFMENMDRLKPGLKDKLARQLSLQPFQVVSWIHERRARHRASFRSRYLHCMAYIDKLAKRNETLMKIQIMGAKESHHEDHSDNESHIFKSENVEHDDYFQGLENIVEENDYIWRVTR